MYDVLVVEVAYTQGYLEGKEPQLVFWDVLSFVTLASK